MTHGTPPKPARIADYRQRVPHAGKLRDLRCVRGPLAEVDALVAMTLQANPGAVLRYEQRNHALGECYAEIVMPEAAE